MNWIASAKKLALQRRHVIARNVIARSAYFDEAIHTTSADSKLLQLFITITVLLGCWQLTVYFLQLPNYILPSPTRVLLALYHNHSVILTQALPTLAETVTGLALGILFGSLAALLIALFKPLSRWCLPLLIISQAIPTFAIAPLLVIWFGFGVTSKIITTVIMVFFPITSALYDGLLKTRRDWLDLAQTMNASRLQTFLQIRIPNALPSLASGIRIAAASAPIGAIVGEWVGSSAGLGYLMLNANARMQIDMMFAVLFVIIILSLSLYFFTDKVLRRVIWWGEQT